MGVPLAMMGVGSALQGLNTRPGATLSGPAVSGGQQQMPDSSYIPMANPLLNLGMNIAGYNMGSQIGNILSPTQQPMSPYTGIGGMQGGKK